MAPKPVDIAHDPARNLLAIGWEDGSTSELPIPYLRGWCPCAGCQGHGSVVTFRPPTAEVHAAALAEVGAYALGITFSDGHDSGIYSWTWLHQLAPESPPGGLKTGVFRGGRFLSG